MPLQGERGGALDAEIEECGEIDGEGCGGGAGFCKAGLLRAEVSGVWLRKFRRDRERGGFLGAFASQFWFLGFSLTAAANVRTLGLVEVLFAHAVGRRVFRQHISTREALGMLLIIAGVGVLMAAV